MRHSVKIERYLNVIQGDMPEYCKQYSRDYRQAVIETLEWVLSKSDAMPIELKPVDTIVPIKKKTKAKKHESPTQIHAPIEATA